MGKLTAKLEGALRTLNLRFKPDQPNIVVYAKLAERGYAWDGNKWARDGFIDLTYPALIRVTGREHIDCVLLSDAIADVLHAHHLTVNVKPPKMELSGVGWRQYIEVE